jgi:hypothetical protein
MGDDPVVAERGVLTAPAEAWDLAVRRAGVIREQAGLGGRETQRSLQVERRRVRAAIWPLVPLLIRNRTSDALSWWAIWGANRF